MTKELLLDYPVFEEKGEHDDSAQEIIYDVRYPSDAPIFDRDGREYEFFGKFLENDDFYQGLNMISVIKRKSDNRLFGFSWWNDISKYGESLVESNGDEFGLECDYHADDFDWDSDYVSYYVFEPVVPKNIQAFEKKERHA